MSIIQWCLDSTAFKTLLIRGLLIRNYIFTSNTQAKLNYKQKETVMKSLKRYHSNSYLTNKYCSFFYTSLYNLNTHFYIIKYVRRTPRSLKENAMLESYVGTVWHHSVATLHNFLLKLSFADQTFEKNFFFYKPLKLLHWY